MTQKELLKYAYNGVLEAWASEHDKLAKNPDNEITKYWEKKHWDALNEIQNMMVEIEEA